MFDTPPAKFSPRVSIPCPYRDCSRWLSSWVMLGIHVSGHVLADEILKGLKRKPSRRFREKEKSWSSQSQGKIG